MVGRNRMQYQLARTLAILAAVVVLVPIAAWAQTVDELVAKNIQAHSGIEKLKAIPPSRRLGFRS